MLDMTILFSNSSPKSPKKRHFWFQILAFLFFHEISQLDKFEGADFNYGNSIFKFQSKNNQIKHFWSQIYRFTKSRALISNISVVFQSCAQNTQEGVCGPRFEDFHFCTKLCFQKHNNSFFKFLHKNKQIKHFDPKLRHFIIALNFAIRKT